MSGVLKAATAALSKVVDVPTSEYYEVSGAERLIDHLPNNEG